MKEQLLELIKEKAVFHGERVLASGKKADFYIDGKQVTLDAQGIFLTSKIMLHMIHGTEADAVGGPTLGADPLAGAISLLSSQSGHPLKAFIVRKSGKDHGMERLIEGPELQEGDRVVMLEDVITTGGSVLKAIEAVEAKKAKVVKVLCLVDRESGAQETLAAYNYSPIFSLTELGLKNPS